MGTIKQVMECYKKAYDSIPEVIANTVQETSDVLLKLNKDQLLQGRDADGNLLSPTYTSDPYFKTPEHARRYSRMKHLLEVIHRSRMSYVALYGEKPTDVPNLIVTGSFQDGMFISVTKDSYTIDSTYKDANDINAKYNYRVYGLALKSREFYYFGFIRWKILELYKK